LPGICALVLETRDICQYCRTFCKKNYRQHRSYQFRPGGPRNCEFPA